MDKRMTISKATPIQLGLVIGIIVMAFCFGVWATKINGSLSDISESLRDIKTILGGHITEDTMGQWIELFRARNPGAILDIPDFPK